MHYDLTNKKEVKLEDISPRDSNLSEICHIDSSVMEINFELYVYNNTVTLLDYEPEKMMAIEIINPNLARMMTQVFDAMRLIGEEIKPS